MITAWFKGRKIFYPRGYMIGKKYMDIKDKPMCHVRVGHVLRGWLP